MFVLLLGYIGFHQELTYANTAEIEIDGQIGGNEPTIHSPNEPTSNPITNLAQPKQMHIELRKFPNTGSIIEKVTPIGLLLLLIYLLLSRWKAHRNR